MMSILTWTTTYYTTIVLTWDESASCNNQMGRQGNITMNLTWDDSSNNQLDED